MRVVVWFHFLPILGSFIIPKDLLIPYYDLTLLHNQHILSTIPNNDSMTNFHSPQSYPEKVCLYEEYQGYDLRKITKLITSEMISKSFDVEGSFHRLHTNLQRKLERHETFNVLFIGGSVCVGHGCDLCQNSHSLFECSWTYRFIRNLQYLLNEIKLHSRSPSALTTRVSPRYCCKSATSTNMGLDILLTQSYQSATCQLSHRNSSESGDLWEPDLIIWDYSVNDLSSRWFRNRSRKDVYEGFVLKTFNMTSQPQLLVFESLNRRLDLKSMDLKHMDESRSDRLTINRLYQIPMVNYLAALGKIQAPPLTPYYAQLESDRHPGWPTHILWAQLMTEVVLSGLRRNPIGQSTDTSTSLTSSPTSTSTQYCLCFQGYTTYLDFENRPSLTNLDALTNVQTAPVDIHGNWTFRADVLRDPYKTGWIYESSQSTDKSQSTCTDINRSSHHNKIVFHCPNVQLGRVKIGYLASYGITSADCFSYYYS